MAKISLSKQKMCTLCLYTELDVIRSRLFINQLKIFYRSRDQNIEQRIGTFKKKITLFQQPIRYPVTF